MGGGARGGTPAHCLGRRIERQKNIYYKIHHSLKWLPVDDFKRNNQPKTGGHEGGEHGGDMRQAGCMGDVRLHRFGGNKVQIEWINMLGLLLMRVGGIVGMLL